MQPKRIEMMHDHVRAIHRALTGSDPPEVELPEGEAPEIDRDSVNRRFGDLEAMARAIPQLAERVPPFSFSPPLDVIGGEREVILELGVPGIERGDVEVQLDGDTLTISGARSIHQALGGRIYFHAEIPRGPFRRTFRLPEPTTGAPRVEVENGVIRVRLAKAVKAERPRA
jgi:HSP20 family protein